MSNPFDEELQRSRVIPETSHETDIDRVRGERVQVGELHGRGTGDLGGSLQGCHTRFVPGGCQ